MLARDFKASNLWSQLQTIKRLFLFFRGRSSNPIQASAEKELEGFKGRVDEKQKLEQECLENLREKAAHEHQNLKNTKVSMSETLLKIDVT